ncbi:MAG: acyl-CoA dehydrogenase family protein [Terricaulis sp.]|nr:acyl-CoA dehydrogenase family protein [Terricaulis sp.]
MTNTAAQNAAGLAEAFAKSAATTDRSGYPAEQAAQLAQAGLFKTHAAPFSVQAEGLRALGQVCGASAWFAATGGAAVAHAAKTSAEALAEIGAGDRFCTIASAPQSATLTRSGGGIRLDGVWPSVGGLDHAEWVILDGVRDGDQIVSVIAPISALKASDFLYFGGVRGVKWRKLEASAIEIPPHRIGAKLDASARLDPLIGAVLGGAEGVYTLYTTATKARISGVGGHAVARFTQVQARLAESHADLKVCRALYAALLSAADAGEADAETQRDQAYIVRTAMAAANRLLSQMGAMGLSETNPVQRQYRDLRVFASAPSFNWDASFAAFGRAVLGVEDASRAA